MEVYVFGAIFLHIIAAVQLRTEAIDVDIVPSVMTPSCGPSPLDDPSGMIQSPGFGYYQHYPENSNCTWEIRAPPGQQISLIFDAFELEEGGKCQYDYLRVNDGLEERSYCGEGSLPGGQEGLLSHDNVLWLNFVSDDAVSRPGFRAHYTQIGTTATTTSPEYVTKETIPEVDLPEVRDWACANGQLISPYMVCDNTVQCDDGSDETSSTGGCQEMFDCGGGQEVPSYLLCNGIPDCRNGFDETEEVGCVDFVCTNGETILSSWKCDGVADCPLGEDEEQRAGCSVDPCTPGLCENGGRCEAEGEESSCICTSQWTGEFCEIDANNECDPSPCLNQAICIDLNPGYQCICRPGYFGRQCEENVGTVPEDVLFAGESPVSADSPSCGYSPDMPCESLEYSLARAQDGAVIKLTSDRPSVMVAPYLWIAHSLTIEGESSAGTLLSLNAALVGLENPDSTRVTLSKVTFSGRLDLGDVELILNYVVLRNATISQEYFRRVDVNQILITLKGCLVMKSVIANMAVWNANNSLYDVKRVSFVAYGTKFISSTINITAVETNVRIEQCNMTTDSAAGKLEPRFGVFIYPGYRFRSDYALKRKRRGLNALSHRNRGYEPGRQQSHSHTYHDSLFGSPHDERWIRDVSRVEELDVANKILIKDSRFYGMSSTGSSVLQVTPRANFEVEVQNSAFENNSRGMSVIMEQGEAGRVYVSQSQFFHNIAHGPGGGIQVDQLEGMLSLVVKGCTFENNIAMGRDFSDVEVDEGSPDKDEQYQMARVSEITGSGGAIGIHVTADKGKCSAEIRSCEFSNNTAQDYGGTLYMTDGVNANIVGNTFKNIPPHAQIRPRMGELLEFRGNIYNANNTFSVQSARDDIPVIAYRAASDGAFMETYNLDFVCPSGYRAKAMYSAVNLTPRRTSIETLLMFCKPCLEGEYTLDLSAVYVDQSSGLHVAELSNASCLKCPYGAWCTNDVRAKANFWGEIYGGQVTMYLCPNGYCCQNDICPTFNVCAPHRTGKLCGSCEPGYSESVISGKCMEDHLCSMRTTFWAFVAAYGFLYVLFFVMEEECQVVISGFTSWFCGGIKKCGKRHLSRKGKKKVSDKCDSPTDNDMEMGSSDEGALDTERSSLSKASNSPVEHTSNSETLEDDKEEEGGGAYMQIFMYFIQISSLITIDILYKEDRKQPLKYLSRIIPNIFGFNTISFRMSTCFVAGSTPVYNAWLKSGFVLYLFGVWFVLFVASGLGVLICGKCCPRPKWMAHISLKARYVTALFNLLLFTYQVLAEKALLLLKCIDIKSEDHTVLFIDGTVSCYQPWQWYVIVFAVTYVFPFCLVLTFAPSLLSRRIITVKTVLICIIFPLFGSPVLIFLYYKKRNRKETRVYTSSPTVAEYTKESDHRKLSSNGKGDSNYEPDQGQSTGTVKLKGTVDGIVGLIADPYRQDLGGGLCWEGMIAFRRLILVCIATFIYNVLTRHIMIVIVCFFSLLFHYRLRPFLRPACNYLENISLTLLVFIAMMNLIKAVYFEAGNIPDGTPDQLFILYDLIEGVLIGVIPLALVSIVMALIALRIIAFVMTCGSRSQPKKNNKKESTTDI